MIPEEYEKCRTYGHSWDDEVPPPPNYSAKVFSSALVTRCDRCATYRILAVNALGEVAGRKYLYPDGYLIPKEQRPTKAELRIVRIRRKRSRRGRKN